MPDPECRVQADHDPDVIAAYASNSPNAFNYGGSYITDANGVTVVRSFAQVRFEAYRRCMRARGLMPQGGVQTPVNPNQPSYRWP